MSSDPSNPSADDLLSFNAQYAGGFTDANLQVVPIRCLAVVACMDSMMDIFEIVGLGDGTRASSVAPAESSPVTSVGRGRQSGLAVQSMARRPRRDRWFMGSAKSQAGLVPG